MRELISKIAYSCLLNYISRLEKINDRRGIRAIRKNAAVNILTETQKEDILYKAESAAATVVSRLCDGKITPMALNNANRDISAYTYYLRYLARVVYKENPQMATKLAFDVYLDILSNKNIPCKNYWDEQYFSVLFGWDKQYVFQKNKERKRVVEETAERRIPANFPSPGT